VILLLLGDSGFGRLQLQGILAAMAGGLLTRQAVVVAGERTEELEPDAKEGEVLLVAEPAEEYLARSLLDLAPSCRVVPPPIGPHLFARCLAARSGGRLDAAPLDLRLPFLRSRGDVTYLSAAAWTCPPDCMAEGPCPAIGLPRTWHLPSLLRAAARAEGVQAVVFRPRGPASGAEGVSAARLQAALRRVQRGGRFLVATAAPCHAAASLLVV